MAIQATNYDQTQEYDVAEMGDLCNDNLLANSDFKSGIINQKGQTSYTKGNEDWGRYYTIDMWAIQRGIQLSVNSNSISVKCTNSSEPGYLMQYVDYVGKATFIIDVQSVTGSVSFNTSEGQYTQLTKGLNVIPFDFSGNWINIRISEGATIVINYMKLEKGSHFTGMPAWDEALELTKCMYHFQHLERVPIYTTSSGGITYFMTTGFFIPMHKDPSMKITELLNSSAQPQSQTLTSSVTRKYGLVNFMLSGSIGQYGYMSCEFDAYDY